MMADTFAKVLSGAIDGAVRRVVVPVTSAIPFLVSSGMLLVVYAVLWVAFVAALATNPALIDDAWHSLQQLPIPVQGVAWLLFMPSMAGLWIWATDWPLVVRFALIAGLAGWNLLVMVPRRGAAREAVQPQSQP